MKSRLVLGGLAMAAILAPPQAVTAGAYRTYVERSVQSGAPTRIWTFYNCIGRKHSPFAGTAFSEHGSVIFKEVPKNRCGIADVPTREVWYTSNPVFTGVDKVTFPRGRGHAEIFAIVVR